MKKFVYILCLFILNPALLYHCVHGAYVPIDYPTSIESQTSKPQLRIPIEQKKSTQTTTTYPSSLWQRLSNWLNSSIGQFKKTYELNKARQIYQMTPPEEEVSAIDQEYKTAKSRKESDIADLEKKDAQIEQQREKLKDEIKQIKEKMNEEYNKPVNERNMETYYEMRKRIGELTNQHSQLSGQHMDNLRRKYELADDKKKIEKEYNQQLAEIKKSRTLKNRMVNPTQEAQEEFTKAIEGNIPIERPEIRPSGYLDKLEQKWQEIKQRPIAPPTPAEKALSEAIDSEDYARVNPDITNKVKQQLKQRWEQSRLRQWFSRKR